MALNFTGIIGNTVLNPTTLLNINSNKTYTSNNEYNNEYNNGTSSLVFGSTIRNSDIFAHQSNDMLTTYTDEQRHNSLSESLSTLKEITVSQSSNVHNYVEVNKPIVLDDNNVKIIHQDIFGNDKYSTVFKGSDNIKFGLATVNNVTGTYSPVNMTYTKIFKLYKEIVPTTYYVYAFVDLINNEVSYRHYFGNTENINGTIYGTDVPYYSNLVKTETVNPESVEILSYSMACLSNNNTPIVLKEVTVPKMSFKENKKDDGVTVFAYNISLSEDIIFPGYILHKHGNADGGQLSYNKGKEFVTDINDLNKIFKGFINDYSLASSISLLKTYKDKKTGLRHLDIDEHTLYIPIEIYTDTTTTDKGETNYEYKPYKVVNSISPYLINAKLTYDNVYTLEFEVINSINKERKTISFTYNENLWDDEVKLNDDKTSELESIIYNDIEFIRIPHENLVIYFNISSLIQNDELEFIEYSGQPFMSSSLDDNIINIIVVTSESTDYKKIVLKTVNTTTKQDSESGNLNTSKIEFGKEARGELYLYSSQEIKVNDVTEKFATYDENKNFTYVKFIQEMSSSYNIQYVNNYDSSLTYKFVEGISSIEYRKDILFEREGIEVSYSYWSPKEQTYVRYTDVVLEFKDKLYGTNIYDFIEKTYNTPAVKLVELFERTRVKENFINENEINDITQISNVPSYISDNSETLINTYNTTPIVLSNDYDYIFSGYSFVEPTRSYLINYKTTTANINDKSDLIVSLNFNYTDCVAWDDTKINTQFNITAYSLLQPKTNYDDQVYIDVELNTVNENEEEPINFIEITGFKGLDPEGGNLGMFAKLRYKYYVDNFDKIEVINKDNCFDICSNNPDNNNLIYLKFNKIYLNLCNIYNVTKDDKFIGFSSISKNIESALTFDEIDELNDTQRRNILLFILSYLKTDKNIDGFCLVTDVGLIVIELNKNRANTTNKSENNGLISTVENKGNVSASIGVNGFGLGELNSNNGDVIGGKGNDTLVYTKPPILILCSDDRTENQAQKPSSLIDAGKEYGAYFCGFYQEGNETINAWHKYDLIYNENETVSHDNGNVCGNDYKESNLKLITQNTSSKKNYTNFICFEYNNYKLKEELTQQVSYYSTEIITQDGYWKRNFDQEIKPFVTLSYTYVNNSLDISNAYIVPNVKNETLGFIHNHRITYNDYIETLVENYKFTYYNDITNIQELFIEDENHKILDLGNNNYYGMIDFYKQVNMINLASDFSSIIDLPSDENPYFITEKSCEHKCPNNYNGDKITYALFKTLQCVAYDFSKFDTVFREFVICETSPGKKDDSIVLMGSNNIKPSDYYNKFYNIENSNDNHYLKDICDPQGNVKDNNITFNVENLKISYFFEIDNENENEISLTYVFSSYKYNNGGFYSAETNVLITNTVLFTLPVFLYSTKNNFIGYDELNISVTGTGKELYCSGSYFPKTFYKINTFNYNDGLVKTLTININAISYDNIEISKMQNLLSIPIFSTDIKQLHRRLTIEQESTLKEFVIQEDELIPQYAKVDTPFALVNGKKVNVIDQIYVPETYLTIMDINPETGEYYTKRVLQTDAYMSYTYEVEDIPFVTATYVFNGGDEGIKIQGLDTFIDYLTGIINPGAILNGNYDNIPNSDVNSNSIVYSPTNLKPFEKLFNSYLSKASASLVYINEAIDRNTKNISYAITASSSTYTYWSNLSETITRLGSSINSISMSNLNNNIEANKSMVNRITDSINNQTSTMSKMMLLNMLGQSGYTYGAANVFSNVFSSMLSTTPKNWQSITKIGYQVVTREEVISYRAEGQKHSKVITKEQRASNIKEVTTTYKYDNPTYISFSYLTAFDTNSSTTERIGLHLHKESRDFTYNGYVYHEDYYTYQSIADILADLHVSTRIPNRKEFIVDVSKRLYINSDFIFSYTSPNEYAIRAIRRADILWKELVNANIVEPEYVSYRPIPNVNENNNYWFNNDDRISAFAYAMNIDMHKFRNADIELFKQIDALIGSRLGNVIGNNSGITQNTYVVEDVMKNEDKQDKLGYALGTGNTTINEETLSQLNDIVSPFQNDTPPEQNEYIQVTNAEFVGNDEPEHPTKKDDVKPEESVNEAEQQNDTETVYKPAIADYNHNIADFKVELTREGELNIYVPKEYERNLNLINNYFVYTTNNDNPLMNDNKKIKLSNTSDKFIKLQAGSILNDKGVLLIVFVDESTHRTTNVIKLLYRPKSYQRLRAPYLVRSPHTQFKADYPVELSNGSKSTPIYLYSDSEHNSANVMLNKVIEEITKAMGYCGTKIYYEYVFEETLRQNGLTIREAALDRYKNVWTITPSDISTFVSGYPVGALYARTRLIEIDKITKKPNKTTQVTANAFDTSDITKFEITADLLTLEYIPDSDMPLYYYNPYWKEEKFEMMTTNVNF